MAGLASVTFHALGDISERAAEVEIDTGAADMLLLGLAVTNADGNLPMVKVGARWAKPVGGGKIVDTSCGSLVLYRLRDPGPGMQTLRVSALSHYMGEAIVVVARFEGVSGDIGRVWTQDQINSSPAFDTPVMDTSASHPGSLRCIFGAGYYGDTDPVLPEGFTLAGKLHEGNLAPMLIVGGTSAPAQAAIDSSDYIPVLWAGIEIIDAATQTAPNPVQVQVTSIVSRPLGLIASSADIHEELLDLGGADLVVVGVQTQYAGVYPMLEFGGQTVRPISFAKVQDADLGSVGFFALKAPLGGEQLLKMIPPQDMGVSNLVVIGLASTSGDIGINWGHLQQGLTAGPIANVRDNTRSLSICLVGTFYDAREVVFPDGWDELPLAVGERTYEDGTKTYGLTGAIGHDGRAMTDAISTEAEGYVQALYSCIEIYDAATVVTASPITVFPQAVADFGWLAASSKTVPLALKACDLLLVCMVWNNERYPPAALYMGPDLLHPIEDSDISYDDSHMQLYAVADVAAGTYDFRAQGYSEAAGQYLISLIGINGSAGQMPVRLARADVTYNMGFELPALSDPRNVYVAFNSAHWQRERATVGSYGWGIVNNTAHPRLDYNVTSYAAHGRYGVLAEFMRGGFESQKTTLFEVQARKTAFSVEGDGALSLPNDFISGEGFSEWLDPAGMKVSVHWDSWGELYARPDQPDSYFLTHLPPYIDEVTICFMRPLCAYKGLDDNIAQVSAAPYAGDRASASILFDGSGHEFKAVLDLLRSRHPGITITLAVQQLAAGEDASVGMTPYSPQGFGGMTEEHFLNIRRFCEDMGITSLDIDYECVVTDPELIASGDPSWWCHYDDNDVHSCYTDTEYRWVVKEFRKYFPRPTYTIKLDVWNIGGFFGPYRNEWEPWWVAGYCNCLTEARDPEAFAAFDGINIMSFDIAPAQYDVVRALESFLHHFPGKKIKPAIRTGAAWATTPDYNRTLGEYAHIINSSLKMGGAGVWIYSLLWDIQSRGDFKQAFSRQYPSGEMKAQLAARLYGKPGAHMPLVTNGHVAPIVPLVR